MYVYQSLTKYYDEYQDFNILTTTTSKMNCPDNDVNHNGAL